MSLALMKIYVLATYFTNQKVARHTFLGDGRVKIHNNSSELGLRSVVVGRANWLFVGDNGGGDRHAVYQSIVMSASVPIPPIMVSSVVDGPSEVAPLLCPETDYRLAQAASATAMRTKRVGVGRWRASMGPSVEDNSGHRA